MRTILIGDVVAAARAMLAIKPDARAALMESLMTEAHAAHLYYKCKNRPHPIWGNGSLMARANLCPQVAEPFWENADYLKALNSVIVGLTERRKTVGPA